MEKKPLFDVRMKVRDYECDIQGVVNNANYLHYFEHARHEMMESCGIYFRDITAENIIPLLRSIDVRYKSSLRGSEEFVCTVGIERQGLRYYFLEKIYRIPDMTLCADARIEIVCLINGKIAEPKLFDEAFARYINWID